MLVKELLLTEIPTRSITICSQVFYIRTVKDFSSVLGRKQNISQGSDTPRTKGKSRERSSLGSFPIVRLVGKLVSAGGMLTVSCFGVGQWVERNRGRGADPGTSLPFQADSSKTEQLGFVCFPDCVFRTFPD